jgi:hypothetical protein
MQLISTFLEPGIRLTVASMSPTSGSKIVMIFKSELVSTLSRRIYLKTHDRELVSELKGDLATLRQQALELPTKSGRDHSGTATSSGSRPVTGDLVAVPTPLAFEQADYPMVPFWTRKDWDTFVEHSKLANKNPPWNSFLTDENGDALSKHRYNELWTDAKLAFNSLYYRRFDPTSWSKKTDLAATYFYNTISVKYPEFRLCEGNWKIHVWTTERYPDWVKNVRKAGGLQRSYLHSLVSFVLIISLLGAVPSIITVGQKRPAPMQNNTKPSKKHRQFKKEDIKQEMPRVQLPAAKICIEDPIIIDDDSDSDEADSIYVPRAKSAFKSSAPRPLVIANNGEHTSRPQTVTSVSRYSVIHLS